MFSLLLSCCLWLFYLCSVFKTSACVELTNQLVDIEEDTPTAHRHRRSTELPATLNFRFDLPDRAEVLLSLQKTPLVPLSTSSGGLQEDDVTDDVTQQVSVYHDMDKGSSMTVRRDGDTYQLYGVLVHQGEGLEVKPAGHAGGRFRRSAHTVSSISVAQGGNYDLSGDMIPLVPNNRTTASMLMETVDLVGSNNASPEQRMHAKLVTSGRALPNTRAMSTQHTVEFSMICDYKDYQYFVQLYGRSKALGEMRTYYTYIANLINIRYQSIRDARLRVQTAPLRLLVLTEDKDDDFISDYVSNNIIRDFAGVLVSVGEYTQENRNLVPTSDHYMVFTQYNLQGAALAVAFVGTACTPLGVSLNENTKHANLGWIAAHEMGHSLSAVHDSNTGSCKNEDQYTMSAFVGEPKPANDGNPWKFSRCSIDKFNNYFSQRTCTLPENTGKSRGSAKLQPPRSGIAYTETQQCNLAFGKSSRYDASAQRSTGGGEKNKCRTMYCSGTGKSTPIVAHEYTPCGGINWCVKGLCVQGNGRNTPKPPTRPRPRPRGTTKKPPVGRRGAGRKRGGSRRGRLGGRIRSIRFQ